MLTLKSSLIIELFQKPDQKSLKKVRIPNVSWLLDHFSEVRFCEISLNWKKRSKRFFFFQTSYRDFCRFYCFFKLKVFFDIPLVIPEILGEEGGGSFGMLLHFLSMLSIIRNKYSKMRKRVRTLKKDGVFLE